MRCLRVLYCILSLCILMVSCSATRKPTYHGVQGSYEAAPNSPLRTEGIAKPHFGSTCTHSDSGVKASTFATPSTLKPLIILDAGHGGEDEGAKVHTFMEKRLALTTSFLVRQHLEELGYRVIMTRSKDIFVPLAHRVAIANKAKGSLFVSVHFNSSSRPEAHGIEIFYFDSKEMWRTKASKRLANCILHRILGQIDAASRGVKQGNFHVIRETDMPAVLVEGGFMTNKEERIHLRDKDYLDRLAKGIAQGIDKYMKM